MVQTFFKLMLIGLFIATGQFASGNVKIVDELGSPCKALLELLELTGIKHDGTLASIVDATQEEWLRKQGTERWEIEETVNSNVDKLYDLFYQLGMKQEIHAENKKYNYLLLLGCSLPAMRSRIVFMQEQWSRGTRFDKIVIAGGPRPLDQNREGFEELVVNAHEKLSFVSSWTRPQKLPQIEFDMMKFVWMQSDILPAILKLPVTWVQIPMKVLESGKEVRPGTVDLLQGWLKTNPKKGSCLVVSSQPFIGYQHSAVSTVLEAEGFEVETIGYAALLEGRVKTYLDNIARWLYQEKKRLSL